MSDWSLGAKRDQMSINADWTSAHAPRIHDVVVKEVKNVPTHYGYLTEVFRRDWGLDDGVVDQVFQSVLNPGAISAWHAHETTTDRLFVTEGILLIALYDARPESPTMGAVQIARCGILRPTIVTVPPMVWHGIKNVGPTPTRLLNLVDRAYDYDDPDHWRLESTDDAIPFDIVTA